MHTRAVIIDQTHVITGSHGWSANSWFRCEELSLLVEDFGAVEALASRFEALWSCNETDGICLRLFKNLPQSALSALAHHGTTHTDHLLNSTPIMPGMDDDAAGGLTNKALVKQAGLVKEFCLPPVIAQLLVSKGTTFLAESDYAEADDWDVTCESDLAPLRYFIKHFKRNIST